MYHDIKLLKRAGYIVEEKSPWHYQVTQGGVVCNIWPSKSKYMVEFGGGASIYGDVVKAVESIVGPAGIKESRAERIQRLKEYWAQEIPVPSNPELYEAWRYELDILVSYVHRRAAKHIAELDAMDF